MKRVISSIMFIFHVDSFSSLITTFRFTARVDYMAEISLPNLIAILDITSSPGQLRIYTSPQNF